MMVRFLFFTLICISSPTPGQDAAWPGKPIRVVYPYSAGGVGDTTFRIVAPAVEARLGQRFVLEAKPGAAGNLGAAEVARAAPDGYTLLLAPTSIFAINPYLFRNPGYDGVAAFEPVTLLADGPLVVLVNPQLPVKTLRELADYARDRPGKMYFASPGSGSPAHLAGELFSQLAGGGITHVAYKGTPPMAQAMLANDVQLCFPTLPGMIALVKAGRLRILAVAARERLAELPDVPTSVEAGFPELVFGNWWGLAAPKGTDARIVARLAEEMRAALADPEARRRLVELGSIAVGTTPGEFAAFIRTEAARYRQVVERGGIKIE